MDLLSVDGDPIGEYCYRLLQARGPDGSPVCTPSCRRIPEALANGGLTPQMMWCKSHGNGETLMDTYLMPLNGTNGDPEMLLYLFRSVDAAGEVKRVLGELSGLHQTAFRAPQVPTPIQGPRASPLSTRETEVLSLLHEGLKTREIANRLHISPATVRNHIQRILGKIKVHSRLQAVLSARRNGWI
jgi:DNA-binding CsgD family transcriptional regulator